MSPADRRLDDAARAAWLAYIAGMKQDEIAAQMGISRQSAQRLVAQAMAAGLVKVRIDHPLTRCMALAQQLTERYELDHCTVVPSLGSDDASGLAVSHATGDLIESWLSRETPLVIGLGTGRTLRAAIEHLPHLKCDQHRVVSLTGNVAPDGSTAFYNVLFTLTDKVSAQTFPLPLPVVTASPEEREALLGQPMLATTRRLAASTDVRFVGIGSLDESAPLLLDGFISAEDQHRLAALGATGDIIGFVFDATGQLIDDPVNARVSSATLQAAPDSPTIAAANGLGKVPAIRAALTGRLITGLITDEDTAIALTK